LVQNCVGYDSKRFFYVRIKTYTSAQDMGRKKKDRNERRRAERRGGGWR
jgi:hypothetical protein